MSGKAVWAILSLATGFVAGIVFSPFYSSRLGWPAWLVFIVLLLDVDLVLYAPIQLREYYAAWQLTQMEQTWGRMVNTSPLQLLILTLSFVVAPLIVFLWLISIILVTATPPAPSAVQPSPTARAILTIPPASSAYFFDVFANQRWQDSRLTVRQGQQFRIEYVSGKWNYWTGTLPDQDAMGDSYVCGRASCCEPAPYERKGALIGKVGNEVFFIGNGRNLTAKANGNLLLRMNDCDTALGDNSGSIRVRITP